MSTTAMPIDECDNVVSDMIKTMFEDFNRRNLTPATEQLTEALVATPRKFICVSDAVKQTTKDEHEALYRNYIEKYNRGSIVLDSEAAKGDEYRRLKLDDTSNRNAIVLHEMFFENCFDPKSTIYANMLCCTRFERDFGTFDTWQRDFMKNALSSREGWAVVGYGLWERKYINFFTDLHDGHIPVGVIPVLVIDMWTHAFKDYGNDRKKYLDAMLAEVNWEVVEKRVQAIESITEVFK